MSKAKLIHVPAVDWNFYDLRGASDNLTCNWALVLRATGQTNDDWQTSAELPTMFLRGTLNEIRAIVGDMIRCGLFTSCGAGSADTIYVDACRLDDETFEREA